MIINATDTKELFRKKIPQKYLEYLKERKVVSEEYLDSLKNGIFGILEENVLFIENKPFCVECFLGASNDDVYDIIRSNELFELEPQKGTAFAVLYGDDFLYFKPDDTKVYYFNRIDNTSVCIAESYNSLIGLIKMEENDENE